jgi:hypothetical protein
MNNIEKKLDALIDALGFDVEMIDVNPRKYDRYPSEPIYDYKLTKREDVRSHRLVVPNAR